MTCLVLLFVLLLPAPVQAQDSRLTDELLGAYVVAGMADLSQTSYCLGAKTCHEANPAMRWAIARSNVPVAMTVKGLWHLGAAYTLHRYHKAHPTAVRWLAASAAVLQMAVVVHNARAVR